MWGAVEVAGALTFEVPELALPSKERRVDFQADVRVLPQTPWRRCLGIRRWWSSSYSAVEWWAQRIVGAAKAQSSATTALARLTGRITIAETRRGSCDERITVTLLAWSATSPPRTRTFRTVSGR